ncbi:hypothetical protein [Arthrobacter luteolus]|uniref:hypothetical protein n=1 Tax=Arthrobacter luteolus TaxID=98672 RepID=UPI00124DAC00|nr:hypothetical protein [Arthrobacter luteolus]
MALDSVPWFIGAEGADHSPAVARMLAYAATNGATGVTSPGDLKVTALPTPGAFVRIAPGGAAILNRYPGAPNQSYTARNATATDVEVTATGSSGGATKYLILRVDDPEFGGAAPANPAAGPYIRPVWVTSITNLAYPFVLLSKLVQPANTATITNAMLTDPRQLANPQTFRDLVVLSGGATVADLTNAAFVRWPNVTAPIAVPEWATHVKVLARVDGAEQRLGIVYAEVQLTLGTSMTGPVMPIDINAGASSSNPARANLGVTMSQKLPTAYPGTTQNLELKARRANAGTDPGFLRADTKTHVQFDVWFTQEAV